MEGIFGSGFGGYMKLEATLPMAGIYGGGLDVPAFVKQRGLLKSLLW